MQEEKPKKKKKKKTSRDFSSESTASVDINTSLGDDSDNGDNGNQDTQSSPVGHVEGACPDAAPLMRMCSVYTCRTRCDACVCVKSAVRGTTQLGVA